MMQSLAALRALAMRSLFASSEVNTELGFLDRSAIVAAVLQIRI